jgi:mannose/fructose/N-acetylgalactosamine-specific phosphotransferase system component IIC
MLEISQGLLFFDFNAFFNLSELMQLQKKSSKSGDKTAEIVPLNVAMKKNIDYLIKLLISQVEFVDKEFSSHIEVLNVYAVYRLQVLTLWLTVVATFLGIVSLLANYQEIKNVICTILNDIQKVLF